LGAILLNALSPDDLVDFLEIRTVKNLFDRYKPDGQTLDADHSVMRVFCEGGLND
jgi:hypothetical protein